MIPTLLVAGMLIAAVPRSWPNRAGVVIGATLGVALLWGLMVGGSAGIVLALVNLALGLGLATWIRRVLARAGDGPVGVRR